MNRVRKFPLSLFFVSCSNVLFFFVPAPRVNSKRFRVYVQNAACLLDTGVLEANTAGEHVEGRQLFPAFFKDDT